jgi:hypothetical protein
MAEERRVRSLWLALLVVLALAAAVFPDRNPLAIAARAQAETIAQASAVTYVGLRSLNAILSTVQEVEVGASLGLSGTVQPAKMLEPVDDTIERIAAAVFALMLATGVVSVGLGPVGAMGAGLIVLACAVWALDRATGPPDRLAALAQRLAWYGGFLVVALPLAFVLAGMLGDGLTRATQDRHEALMAEIAPVLEGSELEPDDAGWLSGLRGQMSEVDEYRALAANIWARADDLIASYVTLLSVYIFRIFVLPALLVGMFLVMARFFAQRP